MLAIALLAGCADDGSPAAPVDGDDDKFDDVDVAKDKGIIRGLVLDPSITPIAGATVQIRDGPSAESNQDGAFLFNDLDPGTYFLDISKLGYESVQSSATVVAGVKDPAILKIQMVRDLENLPSTQEYQFDGFIQCSFTAVVVGLNACGLADIAGVPLDDPLITYTIEGDNYAFAQTELTWESTQPLGDQLSLMYSWDCGETLLCDHEVTGTSPLTLQANRTVLESMSVAEEGLFVRVFGTDTTAVEDSGVGATLDQRFTHFTTIFYGFEPDEGWTLVEDGSHPLPS